MTAIECQSPSSVFRTNAWAQAWLDTWGKYIATDLIDLGGRNHALEMLYRTKHHFKRTIPSRTLCLVGIGCGPLSTPRSEYNDVSHLVQIAGGVGALAAELNKLSWDQLYLPDIEKLSDSEREIATLSESQQWGRYTSKSENSYSIDNLDFEKYLTYLSTSTRLSFFNRRSRLHEQGRIERFRYALKDINTFFSLLNHFHIQRWGRPCYSYNSMKFLENFSERLDSQGGETIFEVINVNGEPVSTLFDVIWDKRRYNFQTGYAQDYLRKISLGSIHLGYAIEESLRENLRYDLLAGSGKKTDYKASISTNTTPLNSIIATRGYWKLIRSAQDYIKSSNSLAFLSKKKGRKT